MFSQCFNKLKDLSRALSKEEKDKVGANLFRSLSLIIGLFKYLFILSHKFDNREINDEEAIFCFINKLDATLLKIGIDIRYIQEQTGIEIKNINRFEISTRAKDLALYFDNNVNLAKYYIEQAEENKIRVNLNEVVGNNNNNNKVVEEKSSLLDDFFNRLYKLQKPISKEKGFKKHFANLLDEFLLKRNIDLKVIQDKSLIQIKSNAQYESFARIKELAPYLGSERIVKHYLEALPDRTKAVFNTIHKLKNVGRNKAKPFIETLCESQKEKRLKALHMVLNGCKGKQVVIYLKACIDLGWLKEKPTFTPVKNEFGDIGNCSGFNKYMKLIFDDAEMSTAKSALKDALTNS